MVAGALPNRANAGHGDRRRTILHLTSSMRAYLFLASFALLSMAVHGQREPVEHPLASAEKAFVNSGWGDYEVLLSKAATLRGDRLERRTGFRFDKTWTPAVSLEWSIGGGGSEGQYRAENQTIFLPIRIVYGLSARHGQTAASLSAETVAGDDELGELLDHELGHALMDQVSRRNGMGPWFTEARFEAASAEEQLGLDILSEGTAQYCQRVEFPRDDSGLSEATFPDKPEQQRFYTYSMLAYDGGYWIVRDILREYRERGLIWLMRHPFVARGDMRAAAFAYRRRALQELARHGTRN